MLDSRRVGRVSLQTFSALTPTDALALLRIIFIYIHINFCFCFTYVTVMILCASCRACSSIDAVKRFFKTTPNCQSYENY